MMTMKDIKYSNRFVRHYKQRIARDERLKRDFHESVEAFREDRTSVNDHALANVMEGQRAFSINDAYRVVYIEQEEYYRFLDVGTHEQVYRR
jgi:mRNA-degrading endonuclease YafQ of YafQ-DinJ toxin-antitoxin module